MQGLPFPWDLFLENYVDPDFYFRWALLHSVSYLFFLYQSLTSSLCTVFDNILSDIDENLSISPSADMFVFGDPNIHHKYELIEQMNSIIIWWNLKLPYSGG